MAARWYPEIDLKNLELWNVFQSTNQLEYIAWSDVIEWPVQFNVTQRIFYDHRKWNETKECTIKIHLFAVVYMLCNRCQTDTLQ